MYLKADGKDGREFFAEVTTGNSVRFCVHTPCKSLLQTPVVCIQLFMSLKNMQQRKSAQPGTIMVLDDAEMALEMIALQNSVSTTYGVPVMSTDLLAELQSAASLIMDKEECEALVRELDAMRQPARIAA
jgi:hypothetical protein